MRIIALSFLFSSFIGFCQNGVFNSAYKGNLSLEFGASSNKYAPSSVSFLGNDYSFTLNNAQFEQFNAGFSLLRINTYLNSQYKIGIGYTVKRGIQVQLNLDNFQYQLAPQTLNITGNVNPGHDITGGLSGTYNSTPVDLDSIAFRFSSTSTKFISLNLNLIQNLYRTKTRLFVLNAIYGLGLGALNTTTSVVFGPAYQNDLTAMAGFGAFAQGGIRIEFFRHFYVFPKIGGGLLLQNRMKLDVSDVTQKASHNLWTGQMSINVGIVFFLGKKKNCDCPHF